MARALAVFVLAASFLVVTGCGGGLTQASMKKYARRRSAPEVEPERAPVPPAPQAAADKPAPPAPAAPAEAKTPGAAVPAEEPEAPAVTSNEKPQGPLTETERRAHSIANLEKIGKALAAYTAKRGRLPTAGTPRDGELLLSWRVLILPELGYSELAARFRSGEPWDGPNNKLLLDYIPQEYQSPERFDVKTNYLAVSGEATLFRLNGLEGLSSGLTPAAVRDGLDNTVAIVEVDDKFAQEWTRPVDLVPRLDAPADRLGGLRGEGTFAALGSGRVVLLSKELPLSRLAALFTAAGGEPIGPASGFLAPPTAEPPPPTLATVADDPQAVSQTPVAAETPSTDAAPATTEAATTAQPAAPLVLAAPFVPDPKKQPVPVEESLAKSRELLKQLYAKEYEEARARQDRQKFLAKLLAEAPSVAQNPADLYELVRIARDLAVALGNAQAALAACDLLEQKFQIDPLPQRLKVLQDLAQQKPDPSQAAALTAACDEARRLVRQAQEADQLDLAISAHEALLVFARILNKDRIELSRLQQQTAELEAAKGLLLAAQRALDKLLEQPSDDQANEAVGRYLCFVKNRWEAGLPYLARAADIRLRGLASLEASPDRTASLVLSLADQYWDLAARFKPPQRRGIHLRAAWCYELAAASLAGGLEKLKAQRRIEEAAALYGREEVNRVLAPLRSVRTGKG